MGIKSAGCWRTQRVSARAVGHQSSFSAILSRSLIALFDVAAIGCVRVSGNKHRRVDAESDSKSSGDCQRCQCSFLVVVCGFDVAWFFLVACIDRVIWCYCDLCVFACLAIRIAAWRPNLVSAANVRLFRVRYCAPFLLLFVVLMLFDFLSWQYLFGMLF